MNYISLCMCMYVCVCVCGERKRGGGCDERFFLIRLGTRLVVGVGKDLILRINFNYKIGVYRHPCFPFCICLDHIVISADFQQKFFNAKVISVW